LSTQFGYKADFNGVGVYVFKHKGQWRMQSIFNTGLEGLNVDTAVNNLTTPQNHCILYDFEDGLLDVKYKVVDAKLTLEYSFGEDDKFHECVKEKKYHGLKQKGYVGISSGNPKN